MAEFSDADVFGAAPAAPTSFSEADVFGPAGGGQGFSDAEVFGKTANAYWSAPRLEDTKPFTFSSVLRNPVQQLPQVWDMVKAKADDALRHRSTIGVGSSALGDFVQRGGDIEYEKLLGKSQADAERLAAQSAARRMDNEKAATPRAARGALENTLGFGAEVGGTILTPESMIALPGKAFQFAGRPILSNLLRHGTGGAIANTLTDVPVQLGQTARGYQDEYRPLQTAMAPFTGFAAGGALGTAGPVAREAQDLLKFLGDKPSALFPMPGDKPPAPVTVDTLWPRLLRQEGGTDKDGNSRSSPAGAYGPAQLMPDTAEDIANRLGKPEWAKLAFENTPQGRLVNELMGKTYLADQLKAFGNDPVLALAAYNAGPGAVRRWVKTFGLPDAVGRERWMAMIPYEETRKYVQNILGGEHLGAEHKLSSADMAWMRGRMDEFPADQEVDLPPMQNEAQAAAAAAAAHAEPAPAAKADFTDDFPGDRPAADAPEREAIPWDDEVAPAPTEIPDGMDMTDQALDLIREGKQPALGHGPSLIKDLVANGGLKDTGGEIANLLGGAGENRLLKQLRRVKSGMTLDEAAQWAQERGYIGRPVGTQDIEGGPRAGQEELLEALRREIAGEPIYPADRQNLHAQMLREQMQDIEDVLGHLGLDVKGMSNADIRRAMDAWMAGTDELEPGWMGEGPVEFGLGGKPAGGADAALRARLAARRANQQNAIVMASTKSGALPGSRTPGAVPAPRNAAGDIDLRAAPATRSMPQIVQRLERALNYPVRQGRMGVRNALGTYNSRSGMTRSGGRYDLNTLAHEFGHALEFTDGRRLPNVLAAMKKHAAALKTMDYAPAAGRRHEGFAEWMRWYVTHPEYLDQIPGARAFQADFEAALLQDSPKTLAAFQEAQRDYQAMLDTSSAKMTAEHVVTPPDPGMIGALKRAVSQHGLTGTAKEIGHEIYRGVIDQLHPWKRAVDYALDVAEGRTGVRPELGVLQDPYKLLRSMPSVAATGHMDLLHGVHGYQSLDTESPSFVDALQLALGDRFLKWDPRDVQDFGTYLTGKRVVDLYDSIGKPGGLEQPPDLLSREAWQQSVDDLEAANPQFAEAADMLYQWNEALWRKRRDAGLITEDQHREGLENHPRYVPLFRDITDKEVGGDIGGQRGSGTKQAGGVVRLKGSDRAYINPLYSMMNMAYELNAQIARNDALKALDDIGLTFGPDVGRVVERIPAKDLKGTLTSVEEVIEGAAKHYGVSRRDAAAVTDAVRQMFGALPDDSMDTSIWRSVATAEKGEPIVYVWREGRRIPLRLPDKAWGKNMVEALAGMTTPMRSFWLDLFSIPAQVLRAGVTWHPAFFLANSFRDQITAAVLTDVGYRPFYDQARGIGHELGQHLGDDELTRIYNVAAGHIGGAQSAGAHARMAEAKLQDLRQKGKPLRHFASWNGFAHFTEVSETGTRLGIFDRALKQAKEKGLGEYEAAKDAAFAARDYLDFERKGGWKATQILTRITPFMNASLQAMDKTARVGSGIRHVGDVIRPLFGGGPPASAEQFKELGQAAKVWGAAMALGVGGLLIRKAYEDDPEYQEVSDYLRATHWVVRLPSGEYGAIPKPYELAVLSLVAERAFEATALKDPSAWNALGEGLIQTFTPAHDIPALNLPFELASNRDSLGAPIVPEHVKDKLPRDQFTDRTSDISKWLGSHIGGDRGVSPAQLDHVVKSLGGSWGREALKLFQSGAPIDKAMSDAFVLERFVKDFTRGANSTKEFYKLVGAGTGMWSQGLESARDMVLSGRNDEATARLKDMKPDQRGYVFTKIFADGETHLPDSRSGKDKHAGQFVKQDHPMVRAEAAARVYSRMARDLAEGNVRGGDLKPIGLDPKQRRQAIHALRELTVAEQRNAMILTGVRGYKDAKPLPYDKYLVELNSASPELIGALKAQMLKGETKVQPLDWTVRNWTQWRNMVEAQHEDEVLSRGMDKRRFSLTKKGAPTAEAFSRALSDVAEVEE